MDCSRVLGCNGEMFSVLPDGRCSPASVPLPSCVLVVGMDLGFHDWGGGGGVPVQTLPQCLNASPYPAQEANHDRHLEYAEVG